MQTQLQSVTAILETAQKDLRVLLLHLRPVELEQKSLVEGIQILLKELEDKSDLRVSLKQNITKLPKKIEEHIFPYPARVDQQYPPAMPRPLAWMSISIRQMLNCS